MVSALVTMKTFPMGSPFWKHLFLQCCLPPRCLQLLPSSHPCYICISTARSSQPPAGIKGTRSTMSAGPFPPFKGHLAIGRKLQTEPKTAHVSTKEPRHSVCLLLGMKRSPRQIYGGLEFQPLPSLTLQAEILAQAVQIGFCTSAMSH